MFTQQACDGQPGKNWCSELKGGCPNPGEGSALAGNITNIRTASQWELCVSQDCQDGPLFLATKHFGG